MSNSCQRFSEGDYRNYSTSSVVEEGVSDVRVRCFTIFSSVRECSSLSASIKFQIVGLVELTILLKPLCHPSASLEDLDVPSHVYSRVPEEEGAAVISGEVGGRNDQVLQ